MTGPTWRMWHAMRAQRGRLLMAALLGFVASASGVALLGTSGWLISKAAEMPPVLSLSVAAVLVRSFALSRSVFRYLERLVGHDAAFRGLTGLRVSIYERLERLAPVGLARFTRGDLLARLVADIDTALDLPLRVVLPWAQAVLVSVATVGFLAWLVPGAGLALGIALLLGLVLVPWLAARTAARAEARLAPTRGELSAGVVASVDGAADLLAFGATPAALARIGRVDDELTSIARREAMSLGLASGLGVLLQGAAVIAAVVAAIPAVTDGRLEPVWLAVAALLPLAAYDVVASLPTSALSFQRVRSAAARVTQVVDEPLPVAEPDRPDAPPVPPYALAARDLVARWQPDGPATVRGIDLALAPGERIAVVGPSGAGKSTLAMVLLKFLAYEGSVSLGGRQLTDLAGDEVRADVGLLTQAAHIFDTTVAANLRLGRADASDDELADVVSRVHLDSWLSGLPDGWDTEVGPRGVTMSGGERQRLALARLLLARRPILVLDEPTEHLDPGTADALTDDLLAVTEGVSTILITHRLRGLDRVDRIYVLVSGEVTAVGRHADLVASGGWYAQRWRDESEQADLAAVTAAIPAGTAVRR